MRYGALVGVSLALVLTASMVGADTVTISMKDRFFSPWRIVVKAGTTVQWVNDDTELHQVISGRTLYDRDLGRPMNSGLLMWNTKYAYTFTNPGSYWYMCVIHSSLEERFWEMGMIGEVMVVP
jgi:plastocyanin